MSDTMTIDKLLEAVKLCEGPPVPFLVSDPLLPNDKAITFEHEGRQHVGAHPDFWSRVDRAKPGANVPLSGVTVWDLTAHGGKRREFYEAMMKVMRIGRPMAGFTTESGS